MMPHIPPSAFPVSLLVIWISLGDPATANEIRQSATFKVKGDSLSAAGGHLSSSTSFKATSLLGQNSPIGLSSSSSFIMEGGILVGGSSGVKFGSILQRPPDADPNGAPAQVLPGTGAFYVQSTNTLIACSVGALTVDWPKQGHTPIRTIHNINTIPFSQPVYLPTDYPNGVDLPSNVVIHYNGIIHGNQSNPGSQNNDVYISSGKLLANQTRPIRGLVILEYQNPQGQYLAHEIVDVVDLARLKRVANLQVGDRIRPLTTPCRGEIIRNQDDQKYLYQHHKDNIVSVSEGAILSGWENQLPGKATALFFKTGLQGVCWPFDYLDVRAVWPTNPQIHIRGGDSVAHPGKFSNAALWKTANGGTLTGNQFATATTGYSVINYQTGSPTGNTTLFQVVNSVEHDDPLVHSSESWDIGNHLSDPAHDPSCNAGYLYSGNNYDPTAYTRGNLTGRVFPVNRGDIEMWWYKKTIDVCWPVKSVIYHCDWPVVPDDCIIISTEDGVGPYNGANTKYQNPSIYGEQWPDPEPVPDPKPVGYNPNEEHARWVAQPGEKLYATRDDINSLYNQSEPYVLLRYNDQTLPVKPEYPVEFDVIRVVRDLSDGQAVGCSCSLTKEPCTFHYDRNAGQPFQPLFPLSRDVPYCISNTISFPTPATGYIWDDKKPGVSHNLWFKRGGAGISGIQSVIGHFWETWNNDCEPWLDDQAGNGTPIDVTFDVAWPQIPSSPEHPRGEEGVYTKVQAGARIDLPATRVEILYNEAGAKIIFPFLWSRTKVQNFPIQFHSLRSTLPPHLQQRLSWDESRNELVFEGVETQGNAPDLLGVMSADDKTLLNEVFKDYPVLKDAIIRLYDMSRARGIREAAGIPYDITVEWGAALTSGNATQSGWVVLGYNGGDVQESASVEIFRIECPLDAGHIDVIYSDCPYDEQITLRWSGDCGGDCSKWDFWWQWSDVNNPADYDDIPLDGSPEYTFTPWSNYTDAGKPCEDQTDGACWVRGRNEIILQGANPRTFVDNWFQVKVRVPPSGVNQSNYPCPLGTESDWTAPQLAEGWVKRIKRGINPFDQRVKDFHKGAVNTYVSMIEQLGKPYMGGVLLSCDPVSINKPGLIEIYQAVLSRAKTFTIDLGVSQYPPVDQALILMAGNLADFYMLLANEAFGDAQDPTVAIDVDTNADAPTFFCFADQLPNLISEELALLRGRDRKPNTWTENEVVFNRLFWNMTLGLEGQVAYKNNYDIIDRTGPQGIPDGPVTSLDAALMYPQGHGDAWGHYLTALGFYYDLLRNPNFGFPNRTESVSLPGSQTPVMVRYAHERKFVKAAAAKARCGSEVTALTYREGYLDNPEEQLSGYTDPVDSRYWGPEDWGDRAFMGAYLDWVTATSILPSLDEEPDHQGTIKRVDRTVIGELRDIAVQADAIQHTLDIMDGGVNPLGLAKNVVPFDISPSELDPPSNKTHFEQVYSKAVTALNNAIVVFNYANDAARSLRKHQDELGDFRNNVAQKTLDFNNRLVEIYGSPYPEALNPDNNNQPYGSNHTGPDRYFFTVMDVGSLLGESLPQGVQMQVTFSSPKVDASDGSVDLVQSAPQQITLCPNRGTSKPANWSQRKAPGQIQFSLSDLLQSSWRLERALDAYNNALTDIEAQADHLQALFNLQRTEILIQQKNNQKQKDLNQAIKDSRTKQLNFRFKAQHANTVANAIAEAFPTSWFGGTTSGGDLTSFIRSAIRLAGANKTEQLNRSADNESITELEFSQAKEQANAEAQIELALLRNEFQAQEEVRRLEQMIRGLNSLEIEIHSQVEAVHQAEGHFLATLSKGEAIQAEKHLFDVQTAAAVTDARYQDMAFRIFHNDALQKYRAQFDLAAMYVYLAAKTYDYETNLLGGSDGRAGEEFYQNILRQRTIGLINQSIPIAGSGLAGVMADLNTNFLFFKTQMGIINPQVESNRFSLRRELFRVSLGSSSNTEWRDKLRSFVVGDLRKDDRFLKLCAPYWGASVPGDAQPALVIPFGTEIESTHNFFGKDLAGKDSNYSTTHYTTKIRSVGVWFSNYNGTASEGGLATTPRIYLVPTGADVMRDSISKKKRTWFLVDQALPLPKSLSENTLINNPYYLPGGNLTEPFTNIRKFGNFRAYHDSGFNINEMVKDSRLVGRSVWNTEWLLIIPGQAFLANPEQGLNYFINGVGGNGGITDILFDFQTYAYGAKK